MTAKLDCQRVSPNKVNVTMSQKPKDENTVTIKTKDGNILVVDVEIAREAMSYAMQQYPENSTINDPESSENG
jgi:hypothetical protein